jgi:DNA-binding HxlR family transcriptional regulator
MRSYKQCCALAKALDVLGDRWTLLIVRELLIRGASRYTDLLDGLPGIATNLLVDRLRTLERAGVLAREEAPPPVATTLFRLTPRGAELEPILFQLGRWGVPLMAKAPQSDTLRPHWLVLPARHLLRDHHPNEPPIAIELRAAGQSITVETRDGLVHTRAGAPARPDAVVTGTPKLIAAVLLGKVPLNQARATGLRYEGNPSALNRVQPLAGTAD